LAASTSGRRGIAASVALIVPEEYSLVTTSTPSTANTSCPSARPARMLLVTSPRGLRVLNPAAMPMPVIPASANTRAHVTERSVRSLIHSSRAA
jgi:hypothetical protein